MDGKIVAAAQEERFSRKKNDDSFPANAIAYILEASKIQGCEVDYVAFYEKPFIKFERLLETYHAMAPRGIVSFLKAMPVWMKDKLYLKQSLRKSLKDFQINAPILFPEHHLSHAASAFYASPFKEAAILTVDGVGEWTTTSIGTGGQEGIKSLRTMQFPHSLGLLYSAFTYYCGFKPNCDEYKLMGLASYGCEDHSRQYKDLILNKLISLREDGSFVMNMDYFGFATGLRMTVDRRWKKLFGVPPRQREGEITDEYIQIAYAIQSITEKIMLRLVRTARELCTSENLVMAGGTALNCVANGKISKSGIFRNLWIQPAAGDAGGAVGAGLAVWHIFLGKKHSPDGIRDAMEGSLLGPEYSVEHIQKYLIENNIEAQCFSRTDLLKIIASEIADGKIVGWFQGRMEYGPRALGNRSILADPRSEDMQRKLNMEIKRRESFRPFAPAVLLEDASEYFTMEGKASPYMLQVAKIKSELRRPLPEGYDLLPYMQKLYFRRSKLQAVTHVDFTARVQTVDGVDNPLFHDLISSFKALTGYGVLVNTSFNVRGEPIVCSPADAYRCFKSTGMDILVLGPFVIRK